MAGCIFKPFLSVCTQYIPFNIYFKQRWTVITLCKQINCWSCYFTFVSALVFLVFSRPLKAFLCTCARGHVFNIPELWISLLWSHEAFYERILSTTCCKSSLEFCAKHSNHIYLYMHICTTIANNVIFIMLLSNILEPFISIKNCQESGKSYYYVHPLVHCIC